MITVRFEEIRLKSVWFVCLLLEDCDVVHRDEKMRSQTQVMANNTNIGD